MTRPAALLTVLGSGTLRPDGARGSASHHLAAGAASVLLDVGSGALHGLARHGVSWEALTHVFLTHFHTDHIGDLAPLMQALDKGIHPPRSAPLTVVGPPGLGRLLESLAGAFGGHVVEPSFPLRIVELGRADALRDEAADLVIRTAPAHHTEEAVSVRVDGRWGALGYTGDTGPSAAVAEGLAGSDVLIAECNQPDPPGGDRHLSPDGVAELCHAIGPTLVLVTHVSPPLTPAEAAISVSRTYDGRVLAAYDGLRVRIAAGDVAVDPPADDL